MPTAAAKSGTYKVEVTEPKATGKAVQNTTKTKISQTWLASQTGPIAILIIPRTRAPRRAPPAVRSQKPAPKSAPPRTRYALNPTTMAAAANSGSITNRPLVVRTP